jgi:hypothetical protein
MATTYLNKTFSTPTNSKKYTMAGWFKRSGLSSNQYLYSYDSGGNAMFIIGFYSSDKLTVYDRDASSGAADIDYTTTQVFRDTAAWYHLVVAVDTTDSTSGDRVKIYVNGTRLTAFDTSTAPAQDYDTIANSAVSKDIGRWQAGSNYYNGYMSQFIFIDGSALTPSSFGSTNANGVWIPNTSPSVTYGNNGFKLDFADSGASAATGNFGSDSSGNNNHFTSNNLGTNPNTKDTPNNIFCTMTSLDKGSNAGTLSLGNLKMTNGTSGSADNQKFRGTMGVTKGKWYFEMKKLANTASIGLLATEEKINQTSASGMLVEYLHQGELRFYNGSGRTTKTTGINSYTTNDIVGCALDMDNRRAYFHKNGVYQGDPTPDPASSPSGAGQMAAILANFTMSPCFMDDTTSSAGEAAMNFGNPPFTIASGNADANGYGNFEYAVPSGYYALCTKNLAQYG